MLPSAVRLETMTGGVPLGAVPAVVAGVVHTALWCSRWCIRWLNIAAESPARLLRPSHSDADWVPSSDESLTVSLHRMDPEAVQFPEGSSTDTLTLRLPSGHVCAACEASCMIRSLFGGSGRGGFWLVQL